jgi:hypothetical protein
VRLSPYVGSYLPRRSPGAVMSETPLASVFASGKYVGAILHRGPKGFEAVADDGASHGCYPSQKEAAAVLRQRALHDCDGRGD